MPNRKPRIVAKVEGKWPPDITPKESADVKRWGAAAEAEMAIDDLRERASELGWRIKLLPVLVEPENGFRRVLAIGVDAIMRRLSEAESPPNTLIVDDE